MQTKKLLWLLFILARSTALGQPSLPPVYKIKTDTPVTKLPDIIKAHGGELKVETKEGEGSKFMIQLPNGVATLSPV